MFCHLIIWTVPVRTISVGCTTGIDIAVLKMLTEWYGDIFSSTDSSRKDTSAFVQHKYSETSKGPVFGDIFYFWSCPTILPLNARLWICPYSVQDCFCRQVLLFPLCPQVMGHGSTVLVRDGIQHTWQWECVAWIQDFHAVWGKVGQEQGERCGGDEQKGEKGTNMEGRKMIQR